MLTLYFAPPPPPPPIHTHTQIRKKNLMLSQPMHEAGTLSLCKQTPGSRARNSQEDQCYLLRESGAAWAPEVPLGLLLMSKNEP